MKGKKSYQHVLYCRYTMFCLDFEYAEQRLSDAHGGQMDMITFPEFAKVK